jgi:hypothetical protein
MPPMGETIAQQSPDSKVPCFGRVYSLGLNHSLWHRIGMLNPTAKIFDGER